MVTAAIDGSIENATFEKDPVFGLDIPVNISGVPDEVLFPKNTWNDKDDYDRQANELAKLFIANFNKFSDVAEKIRSAAPKVK